jgi:hypothetical protein
MIQAYNRFARVSPIVWQGKTQDDDVANTISDLSGRLTAELDNLAKSGDAKDSIR